MAEMKRNRSTHREVANYIGLPYANR